jgi:septal ring factor EnvC (AmiA/AmiB activator)
MNPVAGIIGLAVGALSALGFGLAAASMKTDEVTTAQRSMKDEIKDAERQVSVESEKFSLLANRLLELRSATSLTSADKREMKNVIKSLNDNYSDYLGNINLETAAYNNLLWHRRRSRRSMARDIMPRSGEWLSYR